MKTMKTSPRVGGGGAVIYHAFTLRYLSLMNLMSSTNTSLFDEAELLQKYKAQFSAYLYDL
jgi:hypothetical protein